MVPYVLAYLWHLQSLLSNMNQVLCAACIHLTIVRWLQVVVNDHVAKAVTLVNAGSLMYEYYWKLNADPRVAVSPVTGSVGPGARVVCKLSFTPSAAQQLSQHKVTCQVVNGRAYALLLSGQSCLFYTHCYSCLFHARCYRTVFLQDSLLNGCACLHILRHRDMLVQTCLST